MQKFKRYTKLAVVYAVMGVCLPFMAAGAMAEWVFDKADEHRY